MFLPIKGDGDDRDPSEMTAKEIAIKLAKVTVDPDFLKLAESEEPAGKKEADLIRQMVHDVAQEDPNYKTLTKDTLVGFRSGISYGIALMVKLASSSDGKDLNKKNIKKMSRAFLMPYRALDSAIKGFDDDSWFDNFMKNAKVAPEEDKKKSKWPSLFQTSS